MDSRRLTGPNLVIDGPGAVLDVRFASDEEGIIDMWMSELHDLRQRLGWAQDELHVLRRAEGAWLVATGPIDQLYAIIDLNELAWERASARFRGDKANGPEPELETIRMAARDEANSALIKMQRAAADHDVTFLWDDDEVSLGLGIGSETFSIENIPDTADIDWSHYHDIPLAAVTGTNGKSTNVRLLRCMVDCWGKTPGNSSTDWIRVGDEILDKGDYSGPGGARAVLRDRRVEVGLLEVARGGLLRRGAGVSRVDVALVTNVAEDHMGQYGINTVDDLIDAKLIIAKLVDSAGVLVLNADDEGIVRHAASLKGKSICWFSQEAESTLIRQHIKDGGAACVLNEGQVEFIRDGARKTICSIVDIPITLGGLAGYNISNSLSAAAVGISLGLPVDAVAGGLRSFTSDPESNPGRGNYFDIDGVTVLLDFAHNTHGLEAIIDATTGMDVKRRLITLGTAGDRLESEIRNMAKAATGKGLDRILVTDCVGYERELGPGGVPKIIYDELIKGGESPEHVTVFDSELAGARAALDWAEPGDLLVLLIKAEREAVLTEIRERMSRS